MSLSQLCCARSVFLKSPAFSLNNSWLKNTKKKLLNHRRIVLQDTGELTALLEDMRASIRVLLENYKYGHCWSHITKSSGRDIIIWYHVYSFLQPWHFNQWFVCVLWRMNMNGCVLQVKMISSQGFIRSMHVHCWKIQLKLVCVGFVWSNLVIDWLTCQHVKKEKKKITV